MADTWLHYAPQWLCNLIIRRRAKDALRQLVEVTELIERWSKTLPQTEGERRDG